MISAFCFSYNVIEQQFPFVESLKSWLAVVDEMIVVDGGSTDGSVEAIRNIDSNIKVIEDTKWPKNHTYYDFGKMFDRGYQECKGNIAFKIDLDYITNSLCKEMFRTECKMMLEKNIMIIFSSRYNFILIDRYFEKSGKTFGLNKKAIKEAGLNVVWGFDKNKEGLCEDAIIYKDSVDGINFGDTFSDSCRGKFTNLPIFNYSYVFADKKVAKRRWHQNQNSWRKSFQYVDKRRMSDDWKQYVLMNKGYLDRKQFLIDIRRHPIEIQDKILNLKSTQQGYNFWGLCDTSNYYAKI
jgi:glycosyltransferase involved in cell wall biosynthesis